MHKLFKFVSAVAILAVSAYCIWYIVLLFVFSGGMWGILQNILPKPNPQSRTVAEERERIADTIQQQFLTIEAGSNISATATATHDICYSGESTYMRSDFYTSQCTYKITKYYGFSYAFRRKITDFESLLIQIGWKNEYESLSEMLIEYYDEYYQTELEDEKSPKDYFVSDLPTATIVYARESLELRMNFAERAELDVRGLTYDQEIHKSTSTIFHEYKDVPDVAAVLQSLTQEHQYVLQVSISGEYLKR